MDFTNYTFYIKPKIQKSTCCWFRILVNIVAVLLLVGLFYFSLNSKKTFWPVSSHISTEKIDLVNFHTGDLLLIFNQGHDFVLFPGHMAVVIELPQYSQKFVWDLPNPLKHAPNVLKPLDTFLKNSLKSTEGKLYVQHLHGPHSDVFTRSLLPHIKKMSASIHYRLLTMHDHANFCAQTILGFPGIPDFLPGPSDHDLHYCCSAIFEALIKTQVISSSILLETPVFNKENNKWIHSSKSGITVYPQMFVSADWNINKYVNAPWSYDPVTQLQF
jgi:hypothetical protein